MRKRRGLWAGGILGLAAVFLLWAAFVESRPEPAKTGYGKRPSLVARAVVFTVGHKGAARYGGKCADCHAW